MSTPHKVNAPRTWGETRRRFAVTCQQAVVLARREQNPDEQAYRQALSVHALNLLQLAEQQPPDAPAPGRMSAVPCSTAGCSGFGAWNARALWERQKDRQPPPRLLCKDCLTNVPEQIPRDYQLEPTDPALAEAIVSEAISTVVALDPKIFASPEDPAQLVAFRLGDWHRWVLQWENAQDSLVRHLGAGEAHDRLLAAREEAGTLELLLAIEPSADPPPTTAGDETDSDTPEAAQGREDPPDEPVDSEPSDQLQEGEAGSTTGGEGGRDPGSGEQNRPLPEQDPPECEQDPVPSGRREPWIF